MGTPIGCACNEVCICLQCECCCKNNLEPDMYPACYCCGIACESPSTCCKSEQMCCCLFAACAFPPDEEVPCMIATCCIMCYPTMGCCNTIGTVREKEENHEIHRKRTMTQNLRHRKSKL